MPNPTYPRLQIVDLPGDAVNGPATDWILGAHELYPSPLIFERSTALERGLDEILRYQNSRRRVTTPLAVLGSAGHNRSWGMSAPLKVDPCPFVVIFPETEGPATSPPITTMVILTPSGLRDILILPKPGFDYVTSGDVQKEVIKWMVEMTESLQLSNKRAAMSIAEKLSLPDGRELDIELWQWKGLKRHGPESDVWDLHL